MLDEVEKLGLGEMTIAAVTGDHGEEFLDHGSLGHGKKVYQELVHVPLILYNPATKRLAGKRVAAPVENRFLGRTLLRSAGITVSGFPTPNLVRIAVGAVPPPFAFSEGSYAWGPDQRRLMVVKDRRKYI